MVSTISKKTLSKNIKSAFQHFLFFIAEIVIFTLAIALISIPFSSYLRYELVRMILDEPLLWITSGSFFLLLGITFATLYKRKIGKTSYSFKIAGADVSIEKMAILAYLQEYFKRLFPKHDIGLDLTIRKSRVHIYCELPASSELEQQVLLDKVGEDLKDILSSELGINSSFDLNVSFVPAHA